jgi:hypothetical protein
MAEGLFGADSSVPVTTLINGKNLIELATDNFGETPAVWGRYFTSTSTGGTVEYRHRRENQILRDANIRVLPIARQTKRVNTTQADGSADGQQNAKDLIDTFGVDYLAVAANEINMFLDVEGAPSLSVSYYLGWAQTILAYSQQYSGNRITIFPCVYATQADLATWTAVIKGVAMGCKCNGAWIARWRASGCGAPLPWDDAIVKPGVDIPCTVVFWQYSNDCHGPSGFDCNRINPSIKDDFLKKCVLPPDTPVG